MGHTGCGAVTAALDAKLKKAKEPERIEVLVKLIEPGLKDLDMKAPYPAALAAAVEANVRWSVAQLAGLTGPKEAIRDGRIKLAVIVTLLEYRRGHPNLFADGSYDAGAGRPAADEVAIAACGSRWL
jgi:hypothetical protein